MINNQHEQIPQRVGLEELPARETLCVSRKLSFGLDTEEKKTSVGRQSQGTARTDNEGSGERKKVDDSIIEHPARPCTSFRLGESECSNQGRSKRIQGKNITRFEEGISSSAETSISMDSFILCKHCGQRIKRNDREVHRRTEHNIAQKTIKCKILELNKNKLGLIQTEYSNYQRYIQEDKSVSLYSATKQQADRFLKRLKKQNGGIMYEEQPLILRNDVYKAETKFAPYWIGIPVSNQRGKVNVPLGISSELPEGAILTGAKLLKVKGDFYVFLTIEKDMLKQQRVPTSALAIDVGIRNIATTVNSVEKKPKFYGRELRRLRSRFYQLRKKLQVNGAFEAIKRIGDKESRITDDLLHKISREIVNKADSNNSVIIIGNLKGIRLQRRYSRGFMRKLNSFPFHKLFQFIRYKAQWLGIKVIQVSEAYTSQTCHNCRSKGLRVGGKFKCFVCGHEYNADYNGAFNIMNRGIGQALSQGLILAQPTVRTR